MKRAKDRAAPRLPPRRPCTAGLILVGVGASAGGLEAFTQLLESLDPDAGLALVLVQHLSPHHESALVELLSSHTAMPVVEVTDGVHIRPNHVYVIPPNVADGAGRRCRCSCRRGPAIARAHTPIDGFFASLAAAARDRAIAVVLSGTASDGAIGIREVKAAGGITFAQTPGVGEVRRHAARGHRHGHGRRGDDAGARSAPSCRRSRTIRTRGRPAARRSTTGVEDEQLQRVFDLLRPASGVDFRHYKLPTIRRRLLRRMALHRISRRRSATSSCSSQIRRSARAVPGSADSRHAASFASPSRSTALAGEVFPKLLEQRDPDRPIRAWVCGCATRRGSLLARDGVAGIPAGATVPGAHPDFRHRRQRDGDRARPRRRLSGEHRRATSAPIGCGGSSRAATAIIASASRSATCASSRART